MEVFIDSVKISDEIQENLLFQLQGNVTWYSYNETYDRTQHYVR